MSKSNNKILTLSFYGEPIFALVLSQNANTNAKNKRLYLDITGFRPNPLDYLPTTRSYTSRVVFEKNKVSEIIINYKDQILLFKNIRT
jgi:hypothetical protein